MELSIKFNQYSIKFFHKALKGFNNLWIHLVFKEFNWVSMSKIPSPPFEVENRMRCLGGLIFCSSRENFICFFQFHFWFSSELCMFDLCTIVLMKAFSLLYFLPLKEGSTLFQIWFFGPLSYGGSHKITVFCLSISSYTFLSGMGCVFFSDFLHHDR